MNTRRIKVAGATAASATIPRIASGQAPMPDAPETELTGAQAMDIIRDSAFSL